MWRDWLVRIDGLTKRPFPAVCAGGRGPEAADGGRFLEERDVEFCIVRAQRGGEVSKGLWLQLGLRGPAPEGISKRVLRRVGEYSGRRTDDADGFHSRRHGGEERTDRCPCEQLLDSPE